MKGLSPTLRGTKECKEVTTLEDYRFERRGCRPKLLYDPLYSEQKGRAGLGPALLTRKRPNARPKVALLWR